MTSETTLEKFERLYLHDSMINSLEVLTAEARCRLRLHAGAVLRVKGGDKFDPFVRYAPALLTLDGVREMTFEGRYQLNATIVDVEATPLSGGEYLTFTFDLTGGHDADAYMVKLRIVAQNFALGPG